MEKGSICNYSLFGDCAYYTYSFSCIGLLWDEVMDMKSWTAMDWLMMLFVMGFVVLTAFIAQSLITSFGIFGGIAVVLWFWCMLFVMYLVEK